MRTYLNWTVFQNNGRLFKWAEFPFYESINLSGSLNMLIQSEFSQCIIYIGSKDLFCQIKIIGKTKTLGSFFYNFNVHNFNKWS